ncbi:MAG: hypothetical protein FWH14_01965 [Oscillospiraceae bacterium]|nr:hypothetical protein [Oscillospiraceae bacterium]
MIDTKDVIIIRVPYPTAFSNLAKKSHMYICVNVPDLSCELVKCQSFKPYHDNLYSEPVCRIVEQPDLSRNPFRHPTVIDLDKLFVATRSLFPDQLKAARDVCDALFSEIQTKLGEYVERITFLDAELQAVNHAL